MYTNGEYKNTITSPYSQYSNLSKYNDTNFGPKLPVTSPLQNYQTYLEQERIADYNVLTMNNTEGQYPKENNAYGKEVCAKYFVGEAPSNKFVRPFVPNIKFTTNSSQTDYCKVKNDSIVEGFATTKPIYEDIINKSQKMLLHIFILPPEKCFFSKKLIDDLIDMFGMDYQNYFKIKNIENKEDLSLFTNTGGYAVPYFFSPITNNSETGYNEGFDKIVNSLYSNTKENFLPSNKPISIIDKVKDLRIVIYTMNNCGFCTKIKNMLAKEGLLNVVRIYDMSTIKDKKELKEIRGFPYIKSLNTKKSYTGCPMSIEMLIKNLS